MGMRSGTTFKKRQKELARMEKQRDKAARRIQRKAEKESGISSDTESSDLESLDGTSAEAPKEEAGEPSGVSQAPAGE
jgi:hypothetical protein